MHQRFLLLAITLAAAALVLLGSHRLWQRLGSPAIELNEGEDLQEALEYESGVDGALATLPVRDAVAPSVRLQSWADLTHPTLRHLLCRHDAATWRAVDELLLTTPAATDADAVALARASADGCFLPAREATCTWARAAWEEHATGRLHVAWHLLAHCDDAQALPRLDGADAPPTAITEFILLREVLDDLPLRLPVHLDAAMEVPFAGPDEGQWVEMARALAHYEDAPAQALLLRMHERAPVYAREAIALAMHYVTDAEGRARYQEACAHSPEGPFRCHDTDLGSAVRSRFFDLGFALRRHPERRAEALSLLEACAADADEFAADLCFRRLITLDRTRASLVRETSSRAMAPFMETIALFPTRASIDAFLDAHGVGPTVHPHTPVVLPIDALVARGVAFPVTLFSDGDTPKTLLTLLDAAGLSQSIVEEEGPLVHIYRHGRVIDLTNTAMQPLLAIHAFAQLGDPSERRAVCTLGWAELPYVVCAPPHVLAQLEAAHVYIADMNEE